MVGLKTTHPLINRDNSCCFSGYRPEKLPWGDDENDVRCKALKGKILASAERIYLSGTKHFICGMARGSDLFFCEAIFLLREKHGGITLEAAIPYKRQAENWPEGDRRKYDDYLSRCEYATYVSVDYSKNCMFRRNRYMVDNASVLLAVYDGKPGGTAYTVKHAARRGLEIIEIVP